MSKTKIIVISTPEEVVSVIKRAIDLFKLSGINEIVFLNTFEEANFDDSVLIIHWSLYIKYFEVIRKMKCPIIVFDGVNFRSHFSKRLCKEQMQMYSFLISHFLL